jgi:hypothetical protein
VNAFMLMSILVLCSSFKTMSKRSNVVRCVTAIYICPFQLFITHMLWVSARMIIQEEELRNFAHAFDFQSAY